MTAAELVATTAGIVLRRIRHTHPATEVEDGFLTSEFTLPPDVIAFLRLRRRNIENNLTNSKTKSGPNGPGPNSAIAQQRPSHFCCLAHILIQLFERHLAADHQVTNVAEEKRRARRLAEQPRLAKVRTAVRRALVQTHQRLTQTRWKLFRRLRGHFFSLTLADLVPVLTRSSAHLWTEFWTPLHR